MKITAGLLGAALLAGCSGGNQALLVSGGPEDFMAMGRISEEYGTGEAAAIIPVTVGDQEYTFRIWISRSGRRIMAQTESMAGAAAAGFVRGLTGGLVRGDVEYEPMKQAASDYLATTHGPGCNLTNSRKLTHVGWEWDFECPAPTSPSRPSKRKV